MRAILHLDADAFFASVEQATDRRLRGKPIAVGGEKRGIVASASYEARKFGVYTPMPTSQARRLCPRLIVLPGDFEKYELFSRLMFSYAYDFTPDVEIGSIDEGYFDLTGARKPAVAIGETIQRAIRQSLKLSVSEGIASNKLVSQIASKLQKPAAFQLVPNGLEASFLDPLANKWLPGIGPKTANQLNAAGLVRIGQIAHTPAELLGLLVGSMAVQLRSFAQGIDERPVIPVCVPAKSYSEQQTFAEDTTDEPFLEATLQRMADRLMAKVREDVKSIRTITVKVRYNDMDEQQASQSLNEPTDLEAETYSTISALLRKAWQRRVSLRLVSLKFSNLYDGALLSALPLDARARRRQAHERLAPVVDELRHRFGAGVVMRQHDFLLKESVVSSQWSVVPKSKVQSPKSKVGQTAGVRPSSGAASQKRSGALESSGSDQTVDSAAPGDGRTPMASCETQRYRLAVAQRQRLGSYAARQTDARRTDAGQSATLINTPLQRGAPSSARGFNHFNGFSHPDLAHGAAKGGQAGRLPHYAAGHSHRFNSFNRFNYIPLNLHSYYSFLDSTLSIKAIVELARRYELPAIALTDKNNLHGAVEFAQAAANAGIKPIIGAEIEWQGKRVCLYVQNQTGYHNLCRILTGAQAPQGEHPGGMAENSPTFQRWGIARTGISPEGTAEVSPISAVPSGLMVARGHDPNVETLGYSQKSLRDRGRGQRRSASRPNEQRPGGGMASRPSIELENLRCDGLIAVSPLPELARFFPDRFYLQIESLEAFNKHNGILPCIASFPVHYELPSDRWKYDVVQSIRTLTLLRQQHPQKRLEGDYHFRLPTDLQPFFAADPKLLAHSGELAERCSFEFSLGKPQFPGYVPADGSSAAAFLRRLAMDGLERRYPNRYASLRPQLEQELAIITEVGYEEYFLVMWDILQECRRRGIEWITRGSAADSLVCYCLEISGVCPIRFDLYFRRFLNKERMALNKLPDIDVDFPHDRKDDVIDLIFEKYGPEHTAVVGGFSTFQSRSAFAEVAKVLGVSDYQVRRITERFPHYARAGELAEAIADTQECRELPLQEEPYRTALQMAHFLDGFPRYPKMHPCGLVLSRQPMSEIVPTFISAKNYPTTHFDMDSIEAVGLVKMDILAQGGLAVMRDVKEMLGSDLNLNLNLNLNSEEEIKIKSKIKIKNSDSPPIDLEALEPWKDPEVWNLIANGHARAVHHIESPAMISLCKMCNVQDIDTLIAIVSVIRPGAANESKKMEFARRYQGLSPVRYPHPSLEACLRSTYGLVVYEEHILQICEAFAGLPPGRADVLRRALAKGKTELITQIQNEFTDCARKRGRTAGDIAEVWELVSGFKGYAFCKAHSTAYGVEAYQSAWLKLNYPAEFMAAVLTNGKGFYDPLVYVLECHRLGIPLLPPSVNQPGPQFTVVDEGSGGSVQGTGGSVQGTGGSVQGTGGSVQGTGGSVQGSGGSVQGSGGRVQGSGGSVQGTRCRGGLDRDEATHPGGMTENSPTFQRWDRHRTVLSPEGTAETIETSAVPPGLKVSSHRVPNVETLGYSQKSLRDKPIPIGPQRGRAGQIARQSVKKIRVPLLNVKGLTLHTKETILHERKRSEFTSLTDFYLRVQPLNEEIEAMIQAGAFDEFGQPRTTQYWQFKAISATAPTRPRQKGVMKGWSDGVMEYWSDGLPKKRHPSTTPPLHHSTTPPLHHSITPSHQLWLFPPGNLDRLPSVPLAQPERPQRLRWEEELFGYPVSGHPLELYPNIAWETYCPINQLDKHVGEQIVTCGLVIEQRLFHQITGEPMKFLTIADWTGVVETELFARTYRSYGLNTVRYRVLEIAAKVEPFENGRGHTLRVLRAGKPRMKPARGNAPV